MRERERNRLLSSIEKVLSTRFFILGSPKCHGYRIR